MQDIAQMGPMLVLMVTMLVIGGGGAALAIMAQRTVWKSTPARV